jgi:hypothetical protein
VCLLPAALLCCICRMPHLQRSLLLLLLLQSFSSHALTASYIAMMPHLQWPLKPPLPPLLLLRFNLHALAACCLRAGFHACLTCRGVCSSPELVTRLMVLPHSLLSPTAVTRILPLPSLTCRGQQETTSRAHFATHSPVDASLGAYFDAPWCRCKSWRMF